MYKDYKQNDNKNYNLHYNLLIGWPEMDSLTGDAEILNTYVLKQNNSCGDSMKYQPLYYGN